jgi:hypothetical protein
MKLGAQVMGFSLSVLTSGIYEYTPPPLERLLC